MKALLLKVEKQPSAYGRHFYYAFFKSEDGHSYRSCLKPGMENWSRWTDIVGDALRHELWLDGLRVLKPGLIDADSWPIRIPTPEGACVSPVDAA